MKVKIGPVEIEADDLSLTDMTAEALRLWKETEPGHTSPAYGSASSERKDSQKSPYTMGFGFRRYAMRETDA